MNKIELKDKLEKILLAMKGIGLMDIESKITGIITVIDTLEVLIKETFPQEGEQE